MFPRLDPAGHSRLRYLARLRAFSSSVVISRLHSKPLVRENQKFGPCRFWLAHSLNTLMGKAIASGPKGTLRARRALWVVHTFFVRASDNPLSYDSGARCVRLEEAKICSPMARSSRTSMSPLENQRSRKSGSLLSLRNTLTTTLVGSLSSGP